MSSLALRSGTSQKGIMYNACGPQDSKLTLVCVHGWACQATDCSYLFAELVRGGLNVQAIAVSLPGHGGSSIDKYPIASMSAFAEAVNDLINELELPEVVLVGHSMGVRVVLEAWRQSVTVGKPNVKGIIFLDGSHYKFRQSLFAFDSADARSSGLTQREKADKMAEAFARMFSPQTPREFQALVIAHVRAIDPEYNKAMRKSHIEYDYTSMDDGLEALGKSGLPFMNLQSSNVDDQNQRIPLIPNTLSRWMQFLQDTVPQVKQYVIEDAGHFPQVDQPAAVAARLREFVGALRSPETKM